MWVRIDDEDQRSGEPWIGQVSISEDRDEHWNFELIRNSDSEELLFPLEFPFDGKFTICGLLDLQTDCTLVHPLVTKVDPGSMGVYHRQQRQRVEGICQALVRKAAVADIDQPKFSGFAFSSDSFLAWYGRRGFDTSYTEVSNLRQTRALPEYKEAFVVDGFGQVTCRAGTTGHMSTWEDVFTSTASISIEFAELKSLRDTMKWCWKFETLLQFLTGINTRWPDFGLILADKFTLGEHERNFECELTFGRTPHLESEKVHSLRCGHNCGRGGADLETILSNFCKSDLLAQRIQVINYVRFAKRSVVDNFSAILPVLEEYLRATFLGPDEEGYLNQEKAFFDYIDCSKDLNIVEFAKKHVQLKDKKGPSLKTLLRRAADEISTPKLAIHGTITDRIANRRGKLFHQGDVIADRGDAKLLWEETKAATTILSLSVYKALGIDINSFDSMRDGNCEIEHFFVQAH